MTRLQADLIMRENGIWEALENEEERELLEENNPALLEAYKALAKIAGS